MHEIRVRNDYMGVLAEGPVSSFSTDSRFGTLVGTMKAEKLPHTVFFKSNSHKLGHPTYQAKSSSC